MQPDHLVRLYQSKSDGELIQLAGEADQLTPEAHSLLSAELFRRRIPLDSALPASKELHERAEIPLSFGVTWLGKESAESIDELARLYQSKLDDELLELADEADQLTPEARRQLEGELFRRRIPFSSKAAVRQARNEEVEVPSSTDRFWPPKQSNDFIAEVLRLYHHNFWTFIKFVAPAVLVGTFAVILGRKINLQIAYSVFRRGTSQYRVEMLEMQSIHLAALFTSWIVFCIAYAAICSAVRQLKAGSFISFRDSLLDVFSRIGRFLRVCSFLGFFCMFIFAVTAVGLDALFRFTPARHLHLGSLSFFIVSLVVSWVLLVVLSRFALAVPAVVLDDYRVGQSMFRSDELTEGKWLVLAALVCKSYIGGYIAGMAPFWLAAQIPNTVALPSWFSWVLTATSIAAVTVIEPPMFIGFALLYLRQSATSPAQAEPQLAPRLA